MSHLFARRFSAFFYFMAIPAALAVLLFAFFSRVEPVSSAPDPREAAARRFLSENGCTPDASPCERAEVVIPARFGTVYRQYNELQQSQGYDLTPFRGLPAVRFTFALKEYAAPEEAGPVYANVLFVENQIVAADICAVGIRGFIAPVKAGGG